jgi:signal transduction histidine kinase
MSISVPGKASSSTTTFFQTLWNTLTEPTTQLNNDDKPKARLLAAVLVVYIPIALFAIFISPIMSLISGQVPTLPDTGIFLAFIVIFIGYVLSRTRYYSVGAWFTISSALISVYLPILSTGKLTSIIPLFFSALGVILAGLLLSSRDTLVIGAIVAILTLIAPQPTALSGTNSQNQNVTVFSFVLLTTGITALVGRSREQFVRDLEKSQQNLEKSLAEVDKARIQSDLLRERAERSDQVKSAFLASMSHELRTPLNSIINFTEFVVDGDTGPINDEQKGLLSEVVASGNHLLNLINDVLDMSKIEAGSLKLFVEDDVDLRAILKSSIATGRSLVKDTVHLETLIDENLPLLRGDRQRILQILLNIISNACKFTENGEIKIGAHQEQEQIIISVADTGPGIAVEDQPTVFEAFKQTKTGLRQGGGTGLGMPIAKSLAEAHGGRLWLESVTGKGTTFYVALPIKSAELIPLI